FFAALGGGGYGQPPIETPDELADRVLPDGGYSVNLVNAPMMHGGGQWVSFIAFYAGGTVGVHTHHHLHRQRAWPNSPPENATSIMVVGDAMARPLAEALDQLPDAVDISSVKGIGSGGSILSPVIKDHLRARLPGVTVVDSFGASETGAAGSVLDFGGPAQGA